MPAKEGFSFYSMAFGAGGIGADGMDAGTSGVGGRSFGEKSFGMNRFFSFFPGAGDCLRPAGPEEQRQEPGRCKVGGVASAGRCAGDPRNGGRRPVEQGLGLHIRSIGRPFCTEGGGNGGCYRSRGSSRRNLARPYNMRPTFVAEAEPSGTFVPHWYNTSQG